MYAVLCVVRVLTLPFSAGLGMVTTWAAGALLLQATILAGAAPRTEVARWAIPGVVALYVGELALFSLGGATKDIVFSLAIAGVSAFFVRATWARREQSAFSEGAQAIWVYWVVFTALALVMLSAGKGALVVAPLIAGAFLTWGLPLASSLGMRAYFGSLLVLIGGGLLLSVNRVGPESLGLTISGLITLNPGMLLVLLDIFAQEQKHAHDRRTTAASLHRQEPSPPGVAAA